MSQNVGSALSQQTADGEETSYALIGAVHRLLASSRAATRQDLLLAGACHALLSGDKSTADICRLLRKIWPSSVADHREVEAALQLGNELHLVMAVDALNAEVLWTLTATGMRDIQRHEAWVADVRTRAVEGLRTKASAGLQLNLDAATARLWLDRIVDALTKAIQISQSAYLGNVKEMMDGTLAPRRIEKALVLSELRLPDVPPDISAFLQATAISAIDPLDPFGNELISHITTGCVLHSYVAGRDTQAILNKVGQPDGERAIVDTPVLLSLLGPERISGPVRRVIIEAKNSGWNVIVADHSISELQELLERSIPELEQTFARAASSGTRTHWYASLVDEQLPSLCLEALKTKKYKNFQEIINAGHSIESTLVDLGVEVRHHHNEISPTLVEQCESRLTQVLTESNKGRGTQGIERDANTMAMAWRSRGKSSGSGWPGAWVITSDRAMSEAYLRASNDRVSLTLSASQWTTMITLTAPPPSVAGLAEAAADQLREEAMWLIPARFPSGVAFALAQQLSPEQGGSDTDFRIAQLTLDDAMNQDESGVSIASLVLHQRAERINSLNARSTVQAASSVAEAKQEKAVSEALASQARLDREDALAQARDSDQRASEVQKELDWNKKKLIRLTLSFIGIILLVVALVWGISNAQGLLIASSSLALIVFGFAAFQWVTKEQAKLWPLLVGLVVGGIGFVSDLLGMIDRL